MGQGGGGILAVETIAVPGSGKLKLTGSLGDVRVCFIDFAFDPELIAICSNS
jgi:ATP-dependent Lon protease